MRHIALALAAALLFPMAGSTCPMIEAPMSFVVGISAYMLAVPVEIALTPGSEEGLVKAPEEESGWRLTSSQGFMLALAEAVAEEASAVVP
jgi:hypothetical protein